MARFILDNDYHFLKPSIVGHEDLKTVHCIAVDQLTNHHVTFGAYCLKSKSGVFAHLHPRITLGYWAGNVGVQNELQIYGAVIRGEKLQALIEELIDTNLLVNRQGLCAATIESYSHYFPIHELFNWGKYGVNVPNTPSELWSQYSRMGVLPAPHCLRSFVDAPSESSKKIILNAHNLFVSCNMPGGGPLYLWKVDNPSGHIRNVQLMGRIDCHRDMSRLEVNGVTLQGGKLRSLCDELHTTGMMINASGWCLVIPHRTQNSNYYCKLLHFCFDWSRYGVQPFKWLGFIWPGRNKDYLDDQVQVTGLELQYDEARVKEEFCEKELKDLGLELDKTKKEFYQKEKELKDLGLEFEKIKEEFCQKEKERKDLGSRLQEKNKDLQKQLDQKDQELKKLTKRSAEQNEVIIGSIYREYCNNDSFEKRLQNLSVVSRETHVVLAFARDYDDWDSHTNGIFKVFFDQNVTPLMIVNFKRDWPTTKFFLCIGDRSQRYPFDVTDKHTWIINATTSLKCIIQEYGFDGIDVYYTSSNNTNADDFIYAIGTVIDTLMTQQIITTASIAPCSFMHGPDCNFYAGLYNSNPKNFDFVVFQTHDDDNDVPINDAQQLINTFNKLASDDNFPKEKLVAGHSILPKDWDTLPYPVILTALPQLIKSGVVQGTSVWTLIDDQP